jgi:cytochrome c oxidase assembly factor CtaG
VRRLLEAARRWLWLGAAVLTLVVLLPPVGSYAQRYAFVQAIQFVTFATVVPALLVLGSPWRNQRGVGQPRARALVPGRTGRTGDSEHQPRNAAAWLLVFVALVIFWRLPAIAASMSTTASIAVAEMATLVAAGSGVWMYIAAPPPGQDGLGRPLRAALAAISMWTIWIIAYITGMSATVPGRAASRLLSVAADRQVAVAIMWAVPAIAFMPLIYGLLITWLGEREDPDRELRQAASGNSFYAALARAPRAPRGWRRPPD